MDIRQSFHEILLITFLLCIQDGLSIVPDEDYFDEPTFNRCPWIRNKLKNGRVRYRYKGRVAKFLCDSGFELAGKRSSTCVRGQWSNPVPVCVARGCNRVPSILNGRITEMYRGALLVYDCNPGYMLDGNPTIHCDGRRWNSSPPICVIATEKPETYCDFENPDLCGWSQDPNHDFDWQRNQFSTPSGHVGTGPAFDHTFGENKGGFYLYIEASSPRKLNDTARLFSPVYSQDLSGGCFIFWYHMYGATTGGLRVYLKPESHVFDELKPNWEKYGDQSNLWQKGHMIVPVLHENFQIIVEGLRGESYVGDSAIDDVRLTTNLCDSDDNSTDTTEAVDQYSCRGRCQESGTESACGCNVNCVDEPNFCCRDYYTICTAGNSTTMRNTDEPLPEDYTTLSSVTARSSLSTAVGNTEETISMTTNLITEKLEPTNVTLSVISSTWSSTSTSQTPDSFPNTTISSIIPVSYSVLNISSTKYSSSTEPTTLTTTLSGSSLKTESSTATTSVLKTTICPNCSYNSSATSLSKSTTTANPTISSLKTTLRPPTSQMTSTTIRTTSTKPTTTEITTSTTQTSPKSTNTVASTLLSTLNLPTQTVPIPVLKNESTTTMRSMSTYATDIYTNSTSLATTLTTEPIILSTTTLSTTRRTYNLRPRTRTASSTTLTTLPIDSRTSNAALTSHTPLKGDTSVYSSTTSPLYLTSWYRYSVSSSTKKQSTSPSLEPTTRTMSQETTTTSRLKSETVSQYMPKTTKFPYTINKPTKSSLPKTSDLYESGASKAKTASSNSSVPIVISVIIVLFICLTAGLAYFFKKRKSKRQSKLSDDSEMRFLQESDYMEYSDASALDKILIK